MVSVSPKRQLIRTLRCLCFTTQVCNHPYLLHHTRPEDEEDCEVVGVSTKWQLMDRLVPLMRAAQQRVLILSQSPKSLDLVEVHTLAACRSIVPLYAPPSLEGAILVSGGASLGGPRGTETAPSRHFRCPSLHIIDQACRSQAEALWYQHLLHIRVMTQCSMSMVWSA